MRRKITTPADKPTFPDGLPELTEQQRKFAIAVAGGKKAVEAYRECYDCSGSAQPTIWQNAWQLRHHNKVSIWIDALRRDRQGASSISREQHLERLEELRQLAMETGNVGAAVQAEQLMGKVEGHYTERVAVDVSDIRSTLDQIAAISPELAAQLARDNGLEDNTTEH